MSYCTYSFDWAVYIQVNIRRNFYFEIQTVLILSLNPGVELLLNKQFKSKLLILMIQIKIFITYFIV